MLHQGNIALCTFTPFFTVTGVSFCMVTVCSRHLQCLKGPFIIQLTFLCWKKRLIRWCGLVCALINSRFTAFSKIMRFTGDYIEAQFMVCHYSWWCTYLRVCVWGGYLCTTQPKWRFPSTMNLTCFPGTLQRTILSLINGRIKVYRVY